MVDASRGLGNCIYCLTRSVGSREHIILSALGGSQTSTRIACAECNNLFSHAPHGIDNAVYRFFAPLCTQLWIFTDRGEPPSAIRGLRGSDGNYYDLCPGGIQVPSSQTVQEKPASKEGRRTIALTLPTMARLQRRLPHLQRQYGENLASLSVSELFDPTKPIEIPYQIESTRFFRGLAKSLMNLLGVLLPEAARSQDLDSLREYILNENEDWLRMNINYSVSWPKSVPCRVPAHALILDSRSLPGQLLGLVQMFGVLRFSAVLSSNYSGERFARALVVDPWSGITSKIDDVEHIEFPPDMTVQLQETVDYDRDMFGRGLKHLYAVSEHVQKRTQIMYGIIRGIQQAGIQPGEDTNNEAVANLMARQVAHRIVGLPLTDTIEIDSLSSEIEREQELQQHLTDWARKNNWGDDLAQVQALQRAQNQSKVTITREQVMDYLSALPPMEFAELIGILRTAWMGQANREP